VPPGHVGLGPGLVDEDQTLGVKPALVLLPLKDTSKYPVISGLRPGEDDGVAASSGDFSATIVARDRFAGLSITPERFAV
jgi:hypothetical protein